MREHPAEVSPRPATTQAGLPWSPLMCFFFRLGFCVIALYTLDLLAAFFQRQALLFHGQNPGPFPVPFTAPVWHHVVPWIGSHLLRLAGPVDVSNEIGGDSPYEYILRGTEVAAAAVRRLGLQPPAPSAQKFRSSFRPCLRRYCQPLYPPA